MSSVHDMSGPFDTNLSIQTALDIARNNEGEQVDAAVIDFLDSTVKHVWQRLEAEPNSYVMSKDEFAVFNFYMYRFTGSDITTKAIDRFWRNHQGQ